MNHVPYQTAQAKIALIRFDRSQAPFDYDSYPAPFSREEILIINAFSAFYRKLSLIQKGQT